MPIASSSEHESGKTDTTRTDIWDGGVRFDYPHHSVGTNMTKGGVQGVHLILFVNKNETRMDKKVLDLPLLKSLSFVST